MRRRTAFFFEGEKRASFISDEKEVLYVPTASYAWMNALFDGVFEVDGGGFPHPNG